MLQLSLEGFVLALCWPERDLATAGSRRPRSSRRRTLRRTPPASGAGCSSRRPTTRPPWTPIPRRPWVAVEAAAARARAAPEEVLPGEILVAPSLPSRSSSARYMPFRPSYYSGCCRHRYYQVSDVLHCRALATVVVRGRLRLGAGTTRQVAPPPISWWWSPVSSQAATCSRCCW